MLLNYFEVIWPLLFEMIRNEGEELGGRIGFKILKAPHQGKNYLS